MWRARVSVSFLRVCSNCLVVLILSMVTGCSFRKGTAPESKSPLSQVRSAPANMEEQNVTVSRDEYQRALQSRNLVEAIRLVPTLRSDGSTLPEWRLFSIQPGSPYALLGLRNSDVLVSAEDYAIYDAYRFPLYIKLLESRPSGTIEIRREEQPILLQVKFQ
jgi:type II secretory pathway component PulC